MLDSTSSAGMLQFVIFLLLSMCVGVARKKVKTIILAFWRHISCKLGGVQGSLINVSAGMKKKLLFKGLLHLGEHGTGKPQALFNTSRRQISPEYNTCIGR